MKYLSTIILFFLVSTFVCFSAFGAPKELKIEQNEFKQYEQNGRTVLTGGISQVQELPSGMYGMWQVKGTLLETNDYAKYAPHSSDIWVLRKDGAYVTLMNPQNGASATITVTAVQNNTATFVRGVKTFRSKESEEVTLTLEGDTFYGTDMIISQRDEYGITVTTTARYKINGVKISGESLYKPNNNIRFNNF